MKRRILGLLKPALFSLIPLVVLLGVAEAGLRLGGISWAASDQGWGKRFHPVLGWTLEPGFRRHWFDWDSDDPAKTDPRWRREIRVNSLGFRDDEIEPVKTGGTMRIVAMGDSVTFGWGVEAADAFAGRLESRLAERAGGKRTEVVNAGVPGYSSRQGVLLLRHVLLDLDPDVLIVLYGWNDHYLAPVRDRDMLGRQSPTLKALGGLATRFRVFQGVVRLVGWAARPPREALVARVPMEETRENLREIVTTARDHGIRTMLLTVPSQALSGRVSEWTLDKHEPGADREAFIALHERLNDTIREVARAEGALLVDAAEVIRRAAAAHDARLFYRPGKGTDDVHPDERGHDLIAGAIERTLEETSLLAGAGSGSDPPPGPLRPDSPPQPTR